jgi:putative FmdB family regulatory protein
MPVYEWKCNNCELIFETVRTIARRNDPVECPECGSEEAERVMSEFGFVLVGDDFPSKNYRVGKQMLRRRAKVGRRADEKKKEEPGMKLVPNVDGERVDTWSEAKRLASDKGKKIEGYDKMIRKEKDQKKSLPANSH